MVWFKPYVVESRQILSTILFPSHICQYLVVVYIFLLSFKFVYNPSPNNINEYLWRRVSVGLAIQISYL
jgi:hypothetical protein